MASEKPDLRVPDGSSLRLAVSALIKALRRGQEFEALYWARQIESGYWKYLWRRLRIFASEDVGLADSQAAVLVASLADTYSVLVAERRTKWQKPDRSPLTHAVLYLARCEKSREVDDLLNSADMLEEWAWMPNIGAEVYDIHTDEGKENLDGRDRLRHWVEKASVVKPRVGSYDWRLFILRAWGGKAGFYSPPFLDRLAKKWDREGRLRYGIEGYEPARFDWRRVTPEFEDLEPYEGDLDAPEWQ